MKIHANALLIKVSIYISIYPVPIPEITMMSTFILSKVIPIIRKLDEKWWLKKKLIIITMFMQMQFD